MTSAPRITEVTGHRRWDSRGRPTIEVVVHAEGGTGRALAPVGASTGSGEALELRDGGSFLDGLDVQRAIENVNDRIGPALVGVDVTDQAAVDAVMEELDPTPTFTEIGGNSTVATSLAAAHAAAAVTGEPLWRSLGGNQVPRLPLPEIQIFGGGAHAHNRVDVQDFLVVPGGASSFAEALEWVSEVHRAAGRWLDERGRLAGVAEEGGWWPAFDSNAEVLDALVASIEGAGLAPGTDVGISIDVAATQLRSGGAYRLGVEGVEHDADGWAEVLLGWLDRYPIVSIEDPFAEDDTAGMAAFTAAAGGSVQVVGDDFLVTNADRVRQAAVDRSVNAVLVKPNQAGTVTRARAALEAAHEVGFSTIVSARSGETEDVSIAHLAVGWRSGGVKVGSITRGERTAKWNELLRIEESSDDSSFVGWSGLRGSSEEGEP